MRVKRYVVDSMPEALQQIRSDLGKDAVILNTKEIRSGGFLGLFAKRKIEVIAATESTDARGGIPVSSRKTESRSGVGQSGPAPVLASAPGVAVLERPDEAGKKQSLSPAAAELLGAIAAIGDAPPAVQTATVPVSRGIAAYGGSSKPAPASEAAKPEAASPDDPVLLELKAVKEMMRRLASGAGGLAPVRDPVLERLERHLAGQEILPEIVESIVQEIEAQAESADEPVTFEFALRNAKDRLRILLGANARKTMSPDTRIVHFVGPTGVGKTTTIAKLAAEQVLKQKRKVGFITSDTYRIAAVEQLKTYASILGVPLEVVFSPLDLKKAFEQMKDRDIIFMDTAGRNFRNGMYVSELNALLQTGGTSETYLVLSLTSKYKDMKAIAEQFSGFKLDKVLFTKRDETETFGSIVNLLHDFPLELSYFTNGQNVPEDVSVAEENEIIDLILEEFSDA